MLSNEPSATTVVMMERCSLPCSHMGYVTPQGQCQHRDNTSVGQRDLRMVAGDGCNLPDCRLGCEQPSGHPGVLETRDSSAWGHCQALGIPLPRGSFPTARGDPGNPIPLAVQGRGAPRGGGRSCPGIARGC